MAWTPELIATLQRLWQEGASTAEIGRQLGISKNAVVGKAHRLDLPARPSPIRRSEPVEKAPAARPVAVTAAKAAKPKGPTCQWPIGDPRDQDFHFCGGVPVPGRPYCLAHCEMAYSSGSKSNSSEAA